jgi:hypothetical protein
MATGTEVAMGEYFRRSQLAAASAEVSYNCSRLQKLALLCLSTVTVGDYLIKVDDKQASFPGRHHQQQQ